MTDIIEDLGKLIVHLMDNILFIWVVISFAELAYHLSNGSIVIGIITAFVSFNIISILETSPKEIETRRFSDDVVPCRTMLNASIVLMINRFIV